MIEQEITQLAASGEDQGKRLNDIVDEFRRGRDVGEIAVLLDSSNRELVIIGTWILGELPLEMYDRVDIISRLRDLTRHDAPAVRLNALGALYPALLPEDASTRTLLEEMCCDPSEGVRMCARAAMKRLLG